MFPFAFGAVAAEVLMLCLESVMRQCLRQKAGREATQISRCAIRRNFMQCHKEKSGSTVGLAWSNSACVARGGNRISDDGGVQLCKAWRVSERIKGGKEGISNGLCSVVSIAAPAHVVLGHQGLWDFGTTSTFGRVRPEEMSPLRCKFRNSFKHFWLRPQPSRF